MARSSQRGLRLYHFFFLSGDVQFDLLRPLLRFVTQAVRLRFGLLEQYLQLAAIQRGEHFLAGTSSPSSLVSELSLAVSSALTDTISALMRASSVET